MATFNERKRIAKQLRERVELLRTLIDASPDIICFKDDQGHWLEANQAMLTLFQLEQIDCRGKKDSELAELTHPCYRDTLLAHEIADTQAWQTTLSSRHEEAIPTMQGGERIFDIIKVPIFNADGSRKGLVTLGRDITEHKRAEAKLRQSETRLVEAQHIAHLGHWEWDLIAGREQWSREMFHLLGLTLGIDELTHETFEKALHPDDRDYVLEAFEQSIAEDKPYQVQFRLVWADGTIRHVQAFGKLIRNPFGRPLRILGTAQNITQVKQTEDSLRQANEKLQLQLSELDRRSQEISLLSKMANLLQTCLTLDEAYMVITRFMLRLFPQTMGMLAMYNPQFDTLESVATWENPLNTNQMLTFTPKECWALRQSRSYWMDDARTHPLCQHPFISEQTSVYHCVPLMAQGELLGLLHLAQLPGAIDGINITHRRLAETTAEQIALALANLKLRQTLQNQSIRDPLTNLYNRRYLEETLEREFYRAERSQQPVGIIMVDIDHFKRVNDTFGHDAGDRVLRQLSIFLNEHIRKGDIACRYGGEEFTLILPGANLEVVQRRAELMREKIKHLDIPYGSKNLGPITLSLGVATFPEHGTQLEEVLKAADTALYRAKALGRDRVVIANQIGS